MGNLMRILWSFLGKGGWLILLIAAILVHIKRYGDARADNALLERDVEEAQAAGDSLRDSLRAAHERWRLSDSLLGVIREENAAIARHNVELKAERDTARAQRDLARAELHRADSMLALARHAVDTTALEPPVLQLILAERRAGEAARNDAAACDNELENCEERVANRDSLIAGKDVEIQEQQKQLVEKSDAIQSLETFQLRQDSIIRQQDQQLHPGLFKRVENNIVPIAIGGGLTLAILEIIKGLAGR
jgi:chromosome segregation ATPase